jgi:aminopeptidase N
MDRMEVVDPDVVQGVRHFFIKQLASELLAKFLRAVETNQILEEYDPNHESMARRSLKNTTLAYLASLKEPEMTELVLHEYKSATNMTEQFAALAAISQNAGDVRDGVLSDFYQKWEGDALVIFVSFNFLILP